ncbi:HNH endonuclease [bacterium]|nr:HNH endonuclease [bacterium]
MSAAELHTRLEAALRDLKRAERNAVLLFGEIMRRRLYRDLGYPSIHIYAAEALGFSPSKTSQFVRLAGALEELPKLRRSVALGELGWTKAREVAKVATPGSESRWIAEAARSSSRGLESKVRAARKEARRREKPPTLDIDAGTDALPTDAPVTVSVTFTSEQYARYEALLEAIRKRCDTSLRGAGSAELLLAALHDLAKAPDKGPGAASGPPYQVVVYTCKECGATEARTDRGSKAVSADVACCDARIREPGSRNRATIPPGRRQAALIRAGHRCEAPGCRRTRFLEVHHKRPRSSGGSNEPANLQVLCSGCHQFVHRRQESGAPVLIE